MFHVLVPPCKEGTHQGSANWLYDVIVGDSALCPRILGRPRHSILSDASYRCTYGIGKYLLLVPIASPLSLGATARSPVLGHNPLLNRDFRDYLCTKGKGLNRKTQASLTLDSSLYRHKVREIYLQGITTLAEIESLGLAAGTRAVRLNERMETNTKEHL